MITIHHGKGKGAAAALKKGVGTVFLCLMLMIALAPMASGQANKEVLKLVSHQQANSYLNHWLDIFVKELNEKGQTVKIDYKGGPEVVPLFEALQYISKGTVDLYHGTPAFFAGKIPVGLAGYAVSGSQAELRKVGFYELMDSIYRKKAGVAILGELSRGGEMGCFLKKPLAKADFSGLKLRTLPHLEPLVRTLGGSSVTTDPGEVYTALERGVVDGFLYPQGPALIESKWYEVVKYVVAPTVPYDNCCFLLTNAQRWDALPAPAKKEVMDLLLKMEPEVYAWQTAESAKAIEWTVKQGYLKVTELPPPEAEKYRKSAKDALWNLISKLDPENGPKFREMDEKIRASRK